MHRAYLNTRQALIYSPSKSVGRVENLSCVDSLFNTIKTLIYFVILITLFNC